MSLLSTSETKQTIAKQVSMATDNLQIISAFCKTPAIQFIDNSVRNTLKSKKLLVRFLMSDILAGVTDFDLYDYCKDNGWSLYVRFDLHAKTYIFDRKRCILGSANLTNKGLGLSFHGNCELSCFVDIDESDLKKIDSLFENAILMTDELHEQMKLNLEDVPKLSANAYSHKWERKIEDLFIPKIDTLFTYDFPTTKCPDFDDLESFSFMSCPQQFSSIEVIKNAFRWSKAFMWLYDYLNNCPNRTSYFGEISASLHNALINDPKPYRKDVKTLLANTLAWIEYLKITEIIIDVPNHSQRLRVNLDTY